jgi:uncharacterized Ntn-hydrolase superfamily protein
MKEIVATSSIVGFDPETNSLGVAVQSKFLAVGALVPYARAGAGAVATQALANVAYGPRALELLAQGKTVWGPLYTRKPRCGGVMSRT